MGGPTPIRAFRQPVQPFSFAELSTAYRLNDSTNIDGFASRMAAAELMITAGTNLSIVFNGGWDSHGDRDGSDVRQHMNTDILPALTTLLSRMLADATRNVVVAMVGDFARSLPDSDHAGRAGLLGLPRRRVEGANESVRRECASARPRLTSLREAISSGGFRQGWIFGSTVGAIRGSEISLDPRHFHRLRSCG